MPPAEPALAGWGGGARVRAQYIRGAGKRELQAAVRRQRAVPNQGAIARGMGRSYGDAAQLRGGLVIDTTSLRGFELDRAGGILAAEAGATLGELLGAVSPAGWVLPVVPGTQPGGGARRAAGAGRAAPRCLAGSAGPAAGARHRHPRRAAA